MSSKNEVCEWDGCFYFCICSVPQAQISDSESLEVRGGENRTKVGDEKMRRRSNEPKRIWWLSWTHYCSTVTTMKAILGSERISIIITTVWRSSSVCHIMSPADAEELLLVELRSCGLRRSWSKPLTVSLWQTKPLIWGFGLTAQISTKFLEEPPVSLRLPSCGNPQVIKRSSLPLLFFY